MKLLDCLLSGCMVEEKENFSTATVPSVTSVTQTPDALATTPTAPQTANQDRAMRAGGRTFPHCPRCASYALYRRNNICNYECETCGLRDIQECTARQVQ
jgi:hypothetical protein